jgi:uncharacterized protein YlxW (UPF0749 family)
MNDPHSHRAPEGELPPWYRRIVPSLRTRYSTYRRGGSVWRVLTPLVFIVAGVLFVTSSVSSAGTDLRPGRYDDLADLAADRSERIADLEHESAELQAEIDRLTEGLPGSELDEATAQLDKLRGPAGLQPVRGPGVTITLDDAPERVLDDADGDIGRKIVHQQDIQAVVNAMWAGGAEAVTVQGQRITSTTGIKCVGNSVLLQGVAFPPPYVISAIGDAGGIVSRVDRDPSVQLYLRDVDSFQLGWDIELSDELTFPAYEGPIDTEYARPAATPDDGT